KRISIDNEQIKDVILTTILRDAWNGPFSQMYEEDLTEKTDITHEDISQRVILETSIKEILEKHGFSPKKMSEFCVGKQTTKPPYMNEIIAGGHSADIMDYLLRDSYFTGVEYGRVDIYRV